MIVREYVIYYDGRDPIKVFAAKTSTLFIKDIYGDIYKNINGLWHSHKPTQEMAVAA